ncbi:MAG: hypothetical protein II957_03255, partial [Treponema sp.]|nr:hypothetical protein [Treponema sp.]
ELRSNSVARIASGQRLLKLVLLADKSREFSIENSIATEGCDNAPQSLLQVKKKLQNLLTKTVC